MQIKKLIQLRMESTGTGYKKSTADKFAVLSFLKVHNGKSIYLKFRLIRLADYDKVTKSLYQQLAKKIGELLIK